MRSRDTQDKLSFKFPWPPGFLPTLCNISCLAICTLTFYQPRVPKRFIIAICCYGVGAELLSYPGGATGVMIYDANNRELTEIPVLNTRWPTLRSLNIECTKGSKQPRRGLGYNGISSSQRPHLLLIRKGQKGQCFFTSAIIFFRILLMLIFSLMDYIICRDRNSWFMTVPFETSRTDFNFTNCMWQIHSFFLQ